MNLYDHRIAAGLTAEQLGAATDVSPDTIRNLEKGGRPHTRTAVALTRFFSRRCERVVPASELFPQPSNVVEIPGPDDREPEDVSA